MPVPLSQNLLHDSGEGVLDSLNNSGLNIALDLIEKLLATIHGY